MASDTHPEGEHLQQVSEPQNTSVSHMKTPVSAVQPTPTHSTQGSGINTLEAPGHEFILSHQERGFLVTSPLMSEASLADEHHHPTSSGGVAKSDAGSMDSVEYSHNQHSSLRTNNHPSRSNSGGSTGGLRSPSQPSSSKYQLSVATFHKRNQDTNSFRTGQQFLIKLDLRSTSNEPFKSPMSLILPRKMIQGQLKVRQTDPATTSTSTDNTTPSAASTTPSGQESTNSAHQSQDVPIGDPESTFFLEVTVHLASSDAIVQACPECCHKVEGKVRKPSTGPGAPSKAHTANDNVDPGQILQFCVADYNVDFTHGTSTVMAKVLCSSTHHDKRGNNDRYFFEFSLMQYVNGQKIMVGLCRTKEILFTGNHKNKSMASFSEDKADVKSRVRGDDESATGISPASVTGQAFYSEEPDSIPDEHSEKYTPSHPYTAGRPSLHQSFSSYNSPRQYNSEHIPRIHEPTSPMSVDSPRPHQHNMDKEPFSGHRSPLVGQGSNYGSSNHGTSIAESRLNNNSGFAPVKAMSWSGPVHAPKIIKIIPDVGDMLGGTEVTIFGGGFRDGLIPYFGSLPATNVVILHDDVLTCRTPPSNQAAVVPIGFHSKLSGSFSATKASADINYSYADKRGLVLAELVAEILVTERDGLDDEDDILRNSGTLSESMGEARTEPRLGGLGDLRSKATRVVRRGSMRRDSSDINQRSGFSGSRLNPTTESSRRGPSNSPLDQTLIDDEDFEQLVAEMMSLSVTQSVKANTQSCSALEVEILRMVKNAGELQHISLQNDQRHTMLHLAVALEMNDLVNYLLKEKIEINAADWNGFTALHYAAWMGHTALFNALESHGASGDVLNCHQALPRHLFADSPGTPPKIAAMYHAKSGHHQESRQLVSPNNNLKDDIHAQYSMAKRSRGSSGNVYIKSRSGDNITSHSQTPALDIQRESSHVNAHESHSSSRHIMSSPPQQVRPRPSSQSMHSHSHSQVHHGSVTRSPSPLRESYSNPYQQSSSTSGPTRYLRPDIHPTRTGSMPSHSSSSYHSAYHHRPYHAPPSPSSSPSANTNANGPPSSPMLHHQGSSHGRFPSSPSSYDQPQNQSQSYDHSIQQEERRSDRMLPSFGRNLPMLPFTFQEDSNRHNSGSSQQAVEPHVGVGQKRSGSYHSSPHDGPSSKTARTFDASSSRVNAEHHDYDMQGPALPIDKSRSPGISDSRTNYMSPGAEKDGASNNISTSNGDYNKDGSSTGGNNALDDNGKPVRRTSQASHTCPHPDCNKSFTRPFNLRAHMRVHTAERPYKCDTCALAFSRLHDRNRHAKLHTGIKPFECQYCHHQFIRPDALRRHLGRGGGAGCGQKAAAYMTTTSDGQKQATTASVASASGPTMSRIDSISMSSTGYSSRSSSGSSMKSNTSISSIGSTAPSHGSISVYSSTDWSQSTKLSERLADRVGINNNNINNNDNDNNIDINSNNNNGANAMEGLESHKEFHQPTSTKSSLPSLQEVSSSDQIRRFESPSGMDEDESKSVPGTTYQSTRDDDEAMDSRHAPLEAVNGKSKSPLPEMPHEEIIQSS